MLHGARNPPRRGACCTWTSTAARSAVLFRQSQATTGSTTQAFAMRCWARPRSRDGHRRLARGAAARMGCGKLREAPRDCLRLEPGAEIAVRCSFQLAGHKPGADVSLSTRFEPKISSAFKWDSTRVSRRPHRRRALAQVIPRKTPNSFGLPQSHPRTS